MPCYDFECESCAYYTEIKQSFDDPNTHNCPHCGKKTLVKVFINPPSIMVRGEPSTIGQLADRNTKKMGKYEIEDKNKANGIKPENTVDKKRREINRRINSMTKTQKLKWIKDGD